jgi:N-acetylmuramoyl-L-alanine amidase
MHNSGNVESGFSRIVASGFSRIQPLLIMLVLAAVTLQGQSSDPTALYQQALRRETLLRQELDAANAGTAGGLLLDRIRILVGSFEDLARLFSKSEISDDALSRGGMLSADAFVKFGEAADRDTAMRLLTQLPSRFPKSPLTKQAAARVQSLEGARPTAPPPAPSASSATSPSSTRPASTPPIPSASSLPSASSTPASGTVMLRAIRREVLPQTLRISLELDREVGYYDERIDGPPRVFVDLPNTRPVEALKDATLPFPDGPVKQVRIGRQLNLRTRVVLDLDNAGPHSVYTVYNPYRIVIDFERGGENASSPPAASQSTAKPSRPPAVMAASVNPAASVPAPRATPPAEVRPAPAAPPQNMKGNFSLARQLGLGVTRIVIDPGHGGHDPGARGNGISEADLVLDVAKRLEQLLVKEQNFEVVLTRSADTYVSLEDRTALANKSDADLFLSIHANASTIPAARGIETYFLNFANHPDAEAVAARENAGSSRTMRHLPDIVQAIAMNNKLDESRDLATIVQAALYRELRKTNKSLRNLGVKQAPFMVLVGATMPSVLAEISFMSNRAEAALLKTDKYRQQIAEALLAGILRYQNSLKRSVPQAE